MALFPIIGIAILLVGIFLWSRGHIAEKRLGVPVRHIKSADMGVLVPIKDSSIPEVLRSSKYRVASKSDYVVADPDFAGEYMPIEKKSARVRRPREGDMAQLLTACFCLEEMGKPVKRGRLVYENGIWDIPYGPEQRQMLLGVVAEMRQAEASGWKDMPRNQDHRCRKCVFECSLNQSRGLRESRTNPVPETASPVSKYF